MLEATTQLKLAKDVTYQSMGSQSPGDTSETVVVLSLASGRLYTCNETTAAFLDELKRSATLGQIIAALAPQFDTDLDTLTANMTELATELLQEKLVVIVET